MRFRLLRRRLTISAPRMAVRSALPWPFRWMMLALAFGFCAAIALWAFEFGKDIAGIDRGAKEEFAKLRTELTQTQAELAIIKEQRDKAQSVANTAGTLVATEKSATDQLTAQVRQLEAENRKLQDDLGFFQRLIPSGGSSEGVAIRGLQAERQSDGSLKWQVLIIQASKNAAEFTGNVEIGFSGMQGAKPWAAMLPDGLKSIRIRQYGRLEGVMELPQHIVVKSMTARVLDGTNVKATQTIKF